MTYVSRAALAAVIGTALLRDAQAGVSSDVLQALNAGNFVRADQLIAQAKNSGGVTADLVFAESWIARAYLETGQLDAADRYAASTREWAGTLLAHGLRLDAADPNLATALGAGIEVHAQVLTKRGDSAGAAAFLRAQLARWRTTTLRARIQKNLNLLTIEGHPAPPVDVAHWVGPLRPQPLSALRGHPVLLFFWAHWCVDCKADVPVVEAVNQRFGPRGLKIIGPTQHYGYAQGGDPAAPEKENAWIESTREKFYATITGMPVPVSDETLRSYGVSTTPTIVLIDKNGIVRLYHPGAISFEELAPKIEDLLGSHLQEFSTPLAK